MTICIVDTSILVELLNVPGCASDNARYTTEFASKQNARETFLLPLAVFIETGNHIAHVNDGAMRRSAAERFVELARRTLTGETPFTTTPFPAKGDLEAWLASFPDQASRGIGLADHSLVALWQEQRQLSPTRRVYIWSLEQVLAAYDTRTG